VHDLKIAELNAKDGHELRVLEDAREAELRPITDEIAKFIEHRGERTRN
jgi:hypothetical protein